jgi:lysine-N-methylase
MSPPPIAPRYMSRFRCIADKCEDTCCGGLSVVVNEKDWKRFKVVAQQAGVESVPDTPAPRGQGFELPTRKDGYCVFLDTQKFCMLHKAHGDTVLPTVCVTFPRYISKWGDQLKMGAGSFGCPEVVRQALLAEDAMDTVQVPIELVYRAESAWKVPTDDPDNGWYFHARKVSDTVQRLMKRQDVPLVMRLYALGQLASKVGPYLFNGTEAFQGEGRAAAEAQLNEALQSAESPEALKSAHLNFAPEPLPGELFAEMYLSLLQERLKSTSAPRFHALVSAVMEGYGGPGTTHAQAWKIYLERREKLEKAHGARLRQYFSHHAINHWLHESFLFMPNLLIDVFRLVMLGGMMRWALLGHPEVVRLCEEPAATEAEGRERLDQAAVECFQIVSKQMDMWADLLGLTQGMARQPTPEAMGQMIMLLKGYADPVQQVA